MAKLYFRVASDWQEVVKLRQEIDRLKTALKTMDSSQSPAAFKALNNQLSEATKKMDGMVMEAAKAGAKIEGGFKKKIFDASQVVNGLSEKIIVQKAVIKDIEADVKRLGDAYRIALKRNPLSANRKLEEYNAARKALDEEKAALFGLTQQQAEARLSVKKLRDEYALYNDNAKEIVESNNGIALSWKKALAVIGGVGALKALGSEMVRVRGEFQSMQTAIETIVGRNVAGQLIPQIKKLAKISPLTMSDIVGAEKTMLGFNIQAEETIKYLKAISDISMGESSKFNSLTLAFSQMSAAGKLMGQDLNQMINAGFNPLQIIAEKTGKSIAILKEEMSKGAVSAEMVQQAFIDATSAGGKFYNMSENASKTINGQLSMMQDALDSVFNELGAKSESVIMDGIQMTTSLIENYEKVGKVITGLIATYGAYRTAIMLSTVATSKHTLAEVTLTNVRVIARKAQMALNAAMLTNPYVALAVVVGGLATAMWTMHDSTTAAARAQKEYNDIKDAASEKEEKHKQKIEELLTAARDESLAILTRKNSLEELQKEYPKIFEQYDIEKLKLEDILKLKQKINEEDLKRSVQGRKDDYNTLKQTVANQRRYLQLFDNHDLRKNMSDADIDIWKMFAGKQSYVQVREQMEKNSELLKKYQKDILDDNISAYKSNLENYSKERLEAELKLAQSSASKRNGFAVNGMMVKGGDLESIISSINGVLAKKKSPTTYKQDLAKAKKEWEDAKKKLSEIEKNKVKFTSKQYREAKKLVETTEKSYKDLGGITGSALTKQEKEADKELKKQGKINEQLLSLQRKNQHDEVAIMNEGREKKLAKINADFEAQKQAIEKQAKELAKTNKEAGAKELNKDGLTAEQQSEIDKASKLNAEIREEAENDVYRAELEAMRNYLKEYGTFQEQKLAIAEEYAEKIAKAQSHGEKLSLEKQRDSALLNVDIAAAKQNINWQSVFGDLGMILKEQIQPTIDNLKKLTESEEFKNASYEDQNQIYDLISELESQSGELGGSFKQVAQDLELYRNSLNAYNTAYSRQIEAANKLAEAQKKLKLTKENGGDVSSAEREVEEAQQAFNETTESVKALGEKASENANTLQNSSSKVKNSLEGLASNFDKLKSGSLSDAFDGIKGIGKQLGGKIGDAIANIDPTGIIGGVLSIMDVLKDGVSTIFVSLQDTLFGAVNGILSDVLSGDIVVKTWKGIASNVGNLFNTITFGGFNKLFGIGGNAKEVEHAINRLTDRNETLQTAIEDLTDEMKASKGSKSVEAYNEAKRRQEEVNRNYLQIAQEQAKYSKSHRSWNYYWRGFDQSQIAEFSKKIGRGWNGDIWNLSPEEMKQLRETVDMWNQIQTTGKGGYGERLTDKLNDYIEQAGKIDELQKDLFEGLTGITFESMYDSYISTLMDMTKSAEDAADDISKYFMQAMLSNAIGEQMYDKLKAWYDKFGEYMKEGGLSEDERNNLLNGNEKEGIIGWNEIIKQGFELRDELAAATGYDKLQENSAAQQEASRGFGAEMTHEDAGELSGRFTVLQIAGEEIKVQSVEQTKNLNILTLKADAILSTNVEMRNIADDARNIIASSYLELVQISENTGAIVRPIQQMQKDMEEVKRNTSRL